MRRSRDLIDHALDCELGIAVRHAPKEADIHASRRPDVVGKQVRYGIVDVGPLYGRRVPAARFLETGRVIAREDGLADDAVPPGDDLAILVQSDLHVLRCQRTILAVLHIVLARPHHLHGAARHRLGQQSGVHREVHL